MATQNLYRCTNQQGDYYVVAEHPTQASERLVAYLTAADYGFGSDREPSRIELVARDADHPSGAGKGALVLVLHGG